MSKGPSCADYNAYTKLCNCSPDDGYSIYLCKGAKIHFKNGGRPVVNSHIRIENS